MIFFCYQLILFDQLISGSFGYTNYVYKTLHFPPTNSIFPKANTRGAACRSQVKCSP